MKTSVIISVYNRSDLLLRCLKSLNNQSLLPDEIVLTDDGSTEDIVSILEQSEEDYKFSILYCKQSDIGFRLARCKNNGVRESNGDIMIFLDQDIVTTKNYIKTIVENIREGVFTVSLPIRTTDEQAQLITEGHIIKGNFDDIVNCKQMNHIKEQYWNEKLYYHLHKWHLRHMGLKLRGGVFAIYKKDFLKVNGFDENFTQWGNEDDDLGRRLNNVKVVGINPFKNDYTVHLYHQQNSLGGRKNQEYNRLVKEKAKAGYYFCEFGINSTKDNDEVRVISIKEN